MIDGVRRSMCCAGCEAVAGAILGQGLHDYYRLRERASPVPSLDFEEDLSLYDHPELQRKFVRQCGEDLEASLLLDGIRCSACAWLNEQTLMRLPGVAQVNINYTTHQVNIRWNPRQVKLSGIFSAVRAIGYRIFPRDPSTAEALAQNERRYALRRLFVAGFGMMQVMMYAFPAYLAGDGEMSVDISQLMRWASFVLTLPVVAFSAMPFFYGAWRDIKTRHMGMDVPIALGTGIAFFASAFATATGSGEVYFDSVVMFVFLLLLSRYLEMLARQRATRSLRFLDRMTPEFSHRLIEFPRSLDTERVPVASLRRMDRVLVKPGEIFPADGVVEQGEGSANESMLSGEPRPVKKMIGSEIIGGAVNLSDPLVMRVEKIGADTVMSSILRLIERAAAEKPRITQLADRSASWFVLIVILLATFAGVYWLENDSSRTLGVVIAVLVATCPCALSLATPVALTVAIARFAARGMILAKGRGVETLARATDIVFDKTGTLTQGELGRPSVFICGKVPEDECLAIAAAMERASEHPVAKAIVSAAESLPMLRTQEVRNFPGAGIEAVVDGKKYRIGTLKFVSDLEQMRVDPDQVVHEASVWLAGPNGLLAAFHFEDTARPEGGHVVRRLKDLGLRVHLLSGDGSAATAELAQGLGIVEVEAGASPDRKRDYVAALQRQGRVVVMVGDGINDAPVLAQADVSLAMGSGARMAQARADAVIVSGNLRDIPWAIGAARKMLRIVRQNIAWALVYNLTILPLALMGMLTPWAAAIGMSVSSLLVVLNALRLLDGEIKGTTREPGEVSPLLSTGK